MYFVRVSTKQTATLFIWCGVLVQVHVASESRNPFFLSNDTRGSDVRCPSMTRRKSISFVTGVDLRLATYCDLLLLCAGVLSAGHRVTFLHFLHFFEVGTQTKMVLEKKLLIPIGFQINRVSLIRILNQLFVSESRMMSPKIELHFVFIC